MSFASTVLAVLTGSRTSPRGRAWEALSAAERQIKEREGITAWTAWAERYREAIAAPGGPEHLDETGQRDLPNRLCAFVVARAESPEAAAQMFKRHPLVTIFPGDPIDVIPILPVPPA